MGLSISPLPEAGVSRRYIEVGSVGQEHESVDQHATPVADSSQIDEVGIHRVSAARDSVLAVKHIPRRICAEWTDSSAFGGIRVQFTHAAVSYERDGGSACQQRSARSSTPSRPRSLHMTATRATLCGLPSARKRWQRALQAGSQRIAEVAAMYMTCRGWARPPRMRQAPAALSRTSYGLAASPTWCRGIGRLGRGGFLLDLSVGASDDSLRQRKCG